MFQGKTDSFLQERKTSVHPEVEVLAIGACSGSVGELWQGPAWSGSADEVALVTLHGPNQSIAYASNAPIATGDPALGKVRDREPESPHILKPRKGTGSQNIELFPSLRAIEEFSESQLLNIEDGTESLGLMPGDVGWLPAKAIGARITHVGDYKSRIGNIFATAVEPSLAQDYAIAASRHLTVTVSGD